MHVAEDDILKVALSWIQHDVLNRKSVCYDVLQHVRLPLIERESLLGLIEPELELLIESGIFSFGQQIMCSITFLQDVILS